MSLTSKVFLYATVERYMSRHILVKRPYCVFEYVVVSENRKAIGLTSRYEKQEINGTLNGQVRYGTY